MMEIRNNNFQCRITNKNQLGLLKSLLRPYCLFGVTKGRPCKSNNHQVVVISEHDDVNVVEPLSHATQFIRRNVTTHGVDALFCEGAGFKVWARCSRKRSSAVPCALDMMNEMNRVPMIADDESNDALHLVNLEPGKTMFCHDNCALRVSAMSDGVVQCAMLQSTNSDQVAGSFVAFDDENEVKSMVSSTLNMQQI